MIDKQLINKIILGGIKEIIRVGEIIDINRISEEINSLMRALQFKNMIYDYALDIKENGLFGNYEGVIVYSLINTEKMNEKEASPYEEQIIFNFR